MKSAILSLMIACAVLMGCSAANITLRPTATEPEAVNPKNSGSFRIVDGHGKGIPNVRYRIKTPSGEYLYGVTNAEGLTQVFGGDEPAVYEIEVEE